MITFYLLRFLINFLRLSSRWSFTFCLFIVFSLPQSGFAGEKNSLQGEILTIIPTDGSQRPKIGLALSGGGARGFAHIGVLKVLEELNIPIDFIAGTSMGSVIGGFYALGYSPEELVDIATTLDWQSAFNDNPPRKSLFFEQKKEASKFLLEFGFEGFKLEIPAGLAAGQKLSNLFSLLAIPATGITHFDQLKIPFRAVATDIVTGAEVILDGSQLSLAESIRASMAVPFVFTPLDFGDKLLVDGGLVKNLPVDVVKNMGADMVIAVNVSTPLKKKEELRSLFSIIEQSISLQIDESTKQQLVLADMVIIPDLEKFSSSDFTKAQSIIDKGEEAARAEIESLRKLAESLKKYKSKPIQNSVSTELKINPFKDEIKIERVVIEGNVQAKELHLLKTLGIQEGEIIPLVELEDRITKIFGIGFFESVSFDIEEGQEEGKILKLKIKEREPNLVRFGAHYNDKDKGVGIADLTLSRLGGRSSILSTEFQFGGISSFQSSYFQYGLFNTGFFINPRFFYKDDFQFIFKNQQRIGEFSDKATGFELALGTIFRNLGELTARYQWKDVAFKVKVGGPDLPEFDENLALVSLRSRIDTLDQFPFPNSGSTFYLTYDLADEVLGSDANFHRISFSYNRFFSPFNRQTFSLGVQLGTSLKTDLPTYEDYLFGGPDSFMGYEREELRGDQIAVFKAGYSYKVLDLPLALGKGVHVNLVFNIGNVWESLEDLEENLDLRYGGSIGLALDTLIGPIQVDFGIGDEGRQETYFSAGFPF